MSIVRIDCGTGDDSAIAAKATDLKEIVLEGKDHRIIARATATAAFDASRAVNRQVDSKRSRGAVSFLGDDAYELNGRSRSQRRESNKKHRHGQIIDRAKPAETIERRVADNDPAFVGNRNNSASFVDIDVVQIRKSGRSACLKNHVVIQPVDGPVPAGREDGSVLIHGNFAQAFKLGRRIEVS